MKKLITLLTIALIAIYITGCTAPQPNQDESTTLRDVSPEEVQKMKEASLKERTTLSGETDWSCVVNGYICSKEQIAKWTKSKEIVQGPYKLRSGRIVTGNFLIVPEFENEMGKGKICLAGPRGEKVAIDKPKTQAAKR